MEQARGSTKGVNPKQVFGEQKVAMGNFPISAVIEGALRLGDKYPAYNWRETGVQTMTYIHATMRHMAAYLDGEEDDPEGPGTHLGAMLANVAILIDAGSVGKLVDDRPVRGRAAEMLRARARAPKVTGGTKLERKVKYRDGDLLPSDTPLRMCCSCMSRHGLTMLLDLVRWWRPGRCAWCNKHGTITDVVIKDGNIECRKVQASPESEPYLPAGSVWMCDDCATKLGYRADVLACPESEHEGRCQYCHQKTTVSSKPHWRYL